MPAPARKRSATLARPASESRPILAAVLALGAAYLLVAMLFKGAADQNLLPQWLEQTFGLPAASDATLTDNPCGAFGATLAVALNPIQPSAIPGNSNPSSVQTITSW